MKFFRQLLALIYKTLLRDVRRPLHAATILLMPSLAGLGIKAIGDALAFSDTTPDDDYYNPTKSPLPSPATSHPTPSPTMSPTPGWEAGSMHCGEITCDSDGECNVDHGNIAVLLTCAAIFFAGSSFSSLMVAFSALEEKVRRIQAERARTRYTQF